MELKMPDLILQNRGYIAGAMYSFLPMLPTDYNLYCNRSQLLLLTFSSNFPFEVQ